jgi:2-dehydro-3-deoxyphosphogluconate aldolase/(4S)-4-hydroxy-2-oxoglutarate aldolase
MEETMPQAFPAADIVRHAPSAVLLETRVIAVLRAAHARDYAPVIEALLAGGVRSIELTLSTAGVLEELPQLGHRFGDAVEIGVGTLTDVGQVERLIDAGAAYIVTPHTDPAIIQAGISGGVSVYPGGLTPTELLAGWRAGATAVKVFPASTVGPGYLAQLRGPFPDMAFVPSGGIGIDDAAAWIRAGALAVSLGGPLIGDAFKGGDLEALRRRAATVRANVDEARSTL